MSSRIAGLYCSRWGTACKFIASRNLISPNRGLCLWRENTSILFPPWPPPVYVWIIAKCWMRWFWVSCIALLQFSRLWSCRSSSPDACQGWWSWRLGSISNRFCDQTRTSAGRWIFWSLLPYSLNWYLARQMSTQILGNAPPGSLMTKWHPPSEENKSKHWSSARTCTGRKNLWSTLSCFKSRWSKTNLSNLSFHFTPLYLGQKSTEQLRLRREARICCSFLKRQLVFALLWPVRVTKSGWDHCLWK